MSLAALAAGLLPLGMAIPPTMHTSSGSAPGQQLVVGSVLLSVAGLLTSCFGLIRARIRHLPALRAGIAAPLSLAVVLAGSAGVVRQVGQLRRADERDAAFDYWSNFVDISAAIESVIARGKTPSNSQEASEAIRGLCADIVALPTKNVEGDVVAHARRCARHMEALAAVITERWNDLDAPARPSEEERQRRFAAFMDEWDRIAADGQALAADLGRRFAGVAPHPSPNRGWARVALYCVDEGTEARVSKSLPKISEAFGHRQGDEQIVMVSMKSLEVSLDLADIVKEFGPPDRSYRMAGALRHMYGKLVLQTPEPAGRQRELAVLSIGAPYSWWVEGLRSRAIKDLYGTQIIPAPPLRS